jgi:hypothetical protein
MRVKTLVQGLACSSAGTATSTPILLVAANVGSYWAGDQAVPGEDMGFPSSGNCVVVVNLSQVVMAAGDTIVIKTSNNYYADDGSGESFSAVATFTATTTFPGGTAGAAFEGSNTDIYFDRVPLGEAMEISITLAGSADNGSLSAYLLNN